MGAGAMGCLWAAHLHCGFSGASGPHVSFIDKRAYSNLSMRKELSFSISSPFLAHIPENTQLSFRLEQTPQTIDCLLVCTKSFDALPGLKKLGEAITDKTLLVLFQNGLGSQYDILEAFPDNPIFAAVTTEGANRVSSNQIVHAGSGLTRVGPLNKAAESNDAARALLNYLQPPALDKTLTLQYEKDIWQALWHKLVINCAINPYTALLNCPNGQVRTSRRFIEGWPILKLELSELLNTASYPLSGDEIETLVFDVMQKTSTNISSMLQDIRAGKRTEIDDINGFAARFLAQHTLSSEVNSYLASKVKALPTH
ncbi:MULTISPECIES: ketopantoate reductase family protein [unclassified Oleiphilus]|jgi:2-dehydropantoate 2-reductase|nr:MULTISPECIES: 2-dehydropantoate 2-reductase [unclassified Oleiphilus]KZY33408.1 hypothetical protein A3729_06780 [Oleiphilus sp. HI0043]KZY43517.1 hypothetical protein A3732_14190 [Oleiphilus sp. HI0050]KZY60830.1 hypothetical protein A3735_01690 [Oleiphilus sp. HI0061]KZY76711.1 hypothetical protein A3740_12095 [Oleiphilus sp. HI0068]KZY86282.1 hypothetical protein A3741_02065 [Oleiphilus sp. HI0069]KZY86838.1 hypothetical protein A3743_16060 [Oleiphilus sp. HI0072]KZZ79098.1 hypothetica